MKSHNEKYKKAKWSLALDDKKVKCLLCPRFCIIPEGQRGYCFIRINDNGVLYTTAYGQPNGFGIDPIEKKPLFHFYPNTDILSFGTLGCNLGCKFCQNWQSSKPTKDKDGFDIVTPEEIIEYCKKYSTKSIAYTYNDPNIFGEYVIDVSKLAKENNIKNVMVTAGYINPEAREEVYQYIDAANVDLKSFNQDFYRKFCNAELNPILDTLLWIKKKTNIWLELTTLLIPNENDSVGELNELTKWIFNELGDDVPIHFTAFHPNYKVLDKSRTTIDILERAYNIAIKNNLKYVYMGNVNSVEYQTTYCPSCKKPVIERNWHSVLSVNIKDSKCEFCNNTIDGCFL